MLVSVESVSVMPFTMYAPDHLWEPPPPPGPDWADVNVASYVPALSDVFPEAAADEDPVGLTVVAEHPTSALTPYPYRAGERSCE